MAFHFCTSGSAIAMAGTNANASLKSYASKAIVDAFSEQSEGDMMLETGMDLSGSLSAMEPGVRQAVANVCASKIAMKIITFDPTGYITREHDGLLNVNDDIINRGMKQLKDFDNFSLKDPT